MLKLNGLNKMFVKLYEGPSSVATLFGAVLCCLNILFNKFIFIRGECCIFTMSLLLAQ